MRGYLGEERVEAVDLLPLLDEGVELSDALERKVVHQVDFVRIRDELVLERFDRHRKRRREETNLAVLSRQTN